jgi:hypothetical protein
MGEGSAQGYPGVKAAGKPGKAALLPTTSLCFEAVFFFLRHALTTLAGGLSDGNRRFRNARENPCPTVGGACHGDVSAIADAIVIESCVKGAGLHATGAQQKWFPTGKTAQSPTFSVALLGVRRV